MKLSDFNYDLPGELVAQKPLEERDASRLMVLDRADGSITEGTFGDISGYIFAGDCLVLNDTRVIPARLHGRRLTGGVVEIFLLDPYAGEPEALVRPSKRVREGETIELENGARVTVLGRSPSGRYIRFDSPVGEILGSGHMPLPPYIRREGTENDAERYQTVYAAKDGATAAPTAGLHFTKSILDGLGRKGVSIVYVTLHTGYGTFAPVSVETVEEHVMHSEHYEIGPEAADTVNRVKASGGRVFAVGTTSTRVLEAAADGKNRIRASSGATNLFIYPGYRFKIIDSIITNFHLPESTLLMLVSAFAGREFILRAYAQAVASRFRFFSYGDAMLIK